jgi:hypothetical protein
MENYSLVRKNELLTFNSMDESQIVSSEQKPNTKDYIWYDSV